MKKVFIFYKIFGTENGQTLESGLVDSSFTNRDVFANFHKGMIYNGKKVLGKGFYQGIL